MSKSNAENYFNRMNSCNRKFISNGVDAVFTNEENMEQLTLQCVTTALKALLKGFLDKSFEIGRLLLFVKQTGMFASKYPNFKLYVKTEFDLSERSASRYIFVYTRFFEVREQYSDYSFTQLCELVYLTDEQIRAMKIDPSMSCREIRQLVRPPKPEAPAAVKPDPLDKLNSRLEAIRSAMYSIDLEIYRQDPEGAVESSFHKIAEILREDYKVK